LLKFPISGQLPQKWEGYYEIIAVSAVAVTQYKAGSKMRKQKWGLKVVRTYGWQMHSRNSLGERCKP